MPAAKLQLAPSSSNALCNVHVPYVSFGRGSEGAVATEADANAEVEEGDLVRLIALFLFNPMRTTSKTRGAVTIVPPMAYAFRFLAGRGGPSSMTAVSRGRSDSDG